MRSHFLNNKNARAAIAIAATPSPASRPAARPVLLLCEVTIAAPVGDEEPEACPAVVPPLLVFEVDIVLAIVLEEVTDVVLAVETSVV